MAILKKQGTFQTPASNGTLAITGVGFEPKLVIFHLNHAGDTGLDARVMLGAATSTEQWVEAGYSGDGDTPSDDRRYVRLTECIGTLQSSSITSRASLTSMDSDGFTLNFVSTGSVENITYQAFGGADLDVAVGNVTMPNTTSNFSVSGLSFEPKAIQIATCYLPSGAGQSANFFYNIGAATATDQFSVYAGSDDNEDPSDTFRYHSNTSMLKRVQSGGGTPDVVLGFVSLDTTGFTLNSSVPVGTSQQLPYIAWGGNIDVDITQVTAKNANGLQEVRGLGFEPDFTYAYTIQAGGSVDNATAIGNAAFSLGYSDGTDEFVSAVRALDNKSPSEAFHDALDAFMYTGVNQSTPWNTATYTPDADGFDLNWTDTDGLTREIFTISFVGLGSGAIQPVGIVSGEAFGTGVFLNNQTLSPTGVASGESFGTPIILDSQIVEVSSIVSTEATGTPTLVPDQVVETTGIVTQEATGVPIILSGSNITATSIPSEEVIGSHSLHYDQIIVVDGIASGEVFGLTILHDGEIQTSPMFRPIFSDVMIEVIREPNDSRT